MAEVRIFPDFGESPLKKKIPIPPLKMIFLIFVLKIPPLGGRFREIEAHQRIRRICLTGGRYIY